MSRWWGRVAECLFLIDQLYRLKGSLAVNPIFAPMSGPRCRTKVSQARPNENMPSLTRYSLLLPGKRAILGLIDVSPISRWSAQQVLDSQWIAQDLHALKELYNRLVIAN